MSEKRIYDYPAYKELSAMPAIPPTGFWKLYPKAAGWYMLNSAGVETLLSSGTGGHVIADEGTPLPAQATLNFVGAGVTVTNGVGETVVTIPGGAGLSTASNGLTASLGDVTLGGNLTANTDILGGGTYDLNLGTSLSRLANANILANTQISLQALSGATYGQLVAGTTNVSAGFVNAGGVSNVTVGSSGVILSTQPTAGTTNYLRFRVTNTSVTNNGSNNRMIIQDDANLKGFVYIADYSANFTPESLVTKRYVDNAVSGAGLTTASNGLTATLGDVKLGGTLTQNTLIDGNYTLQIGTVTPISAFDLNAGSYVGDYTTLHSESTQINLTAIESTGGFQFVGVDTTVGVRIEATNSVGSLATSIFIYNTEQAIANNSTNNTLVIYDNISSKGAVYADDYSANFTPESLVSKRYVDSVVVGASSLSAVLAIGNTTGANNISISSGQAVQYNEGLGGFLISAVTTGAAKYWTLPDLEGTLAIAGKFKLDITTIGAGSYSVLATDTYVGKTAISPGGDTVTLPTLASTVGQIFVIADQAGVVGPASVLTVSAQVGEFIDGVGSVDITATYGTGMFFNTGTMWKILN